MSINERYQDPGTFRVPFLESAPYDILERCEEFGHIVITSQWAPRPVEFNDAHLLSRARYAGVVLEPEWRNGRVTLAGQGMPWHLGDSEGVGDQLESGVNFSGSSLSSVLSSSGLLPDAITQGTITTTGLSTYSGHHRYETPLEAIRTVMTTLGAHFRVNPDGTIDASSTERDEVYVFTTPHVVVVRQGWGADIQQRGIPSEDLTTRRRAQDWASRVIVVEGSEDAGFTLKGAADRSHSYFDIHGNALVRTYRDSRPALDDDVSLGEYADTVLDQRDIEDEQEIDTKDVEIDGGTAAVGDMVYVYDPPSGFVDTTNQLYFRGRVIWPKKTRLLEAEWPVTNGMGVYYRPGGAAITTADWIDLTRYVAWEA